jgi:hypothetical protein
MEDVVRSVQKTPFAAPVRVGQIRFTPANPRRSIRSNGFTAPVVLKDIFMDAQLKELRASACAVAYWHVSGTKINAPRRIEMEGCD